MYLATVIDAFSRKVVGWSVDDHMRTSLVVDALDAAITTRNPHIGQAVFHADRGTQGGFNWSPQRLYCGDVCGSAGGLDEGVDGQVGDEVAGSAVA